MALEDVVIQRIEIALDNVVDQPQIFQARDVVRPRNEINAEFVEVSSFICYLSISLSI